MTSIGFFCWPNEYFSFGNIANAIDVHRWPFPARSSCSSISISLWLIHNPVNPFPARWHRCQFSHQRQLLKPLATTKTWVTTVLVLAPFSLTRFFRTFPTRPAVTARHSESREPAKQSLTKIFACTLGALVRIAVLGMQLLLSAAVPRVLPSAAAH